MSLHWSAYSRAFDTARGEHLLYNALSNTLLQLDDAHDRAARLVRELSSLPGGVGEARLHAAVAGTTTEPDASASPPDPSAGAAFVSALRTGRMLVNPGEEASLLAAERHARLSAASAAGLLGLTLCPTLACNFRCGYCFERSQRDATAMSDETADQLIAFIRRHEDARRLAVSWYGGEPTLAWDRIADLTSRFRELELEYLPAGLVTNGYLLDGVRVRQLSELGIGSIQVTLDGPREVHDTRRTLADGRGTYERIVANLDDLFASGWQGRLTLRVNIDRDNTGAFVDLREALLERWAGRPLRIYAGHVSLDGHEAQNGHCTLQAEDWARFTLGLYANHGLLPPRGFYPPSQPGGCVATAVQGYVVGPTGDLYDCWEDVGLPEMAVGHIGADPPIADSQLHAEYSVGIDPFDDPDCRGCHALPICGGGCANRRLRMRRGEEGLEVCTPLKDHLEQYLEAYFDAYLTRELCDALLTPGAPATWTGWRDVSPAPAVAAQGGSPLDEV